MARYFDVDCAYVPFIYIYILQNFKFYAITLQIIDVCVCYVCELCARVRHAVRRLYKLRKLIYFSGAVQN